MKQTNPLNIEFFKIKKDYALTDAVLAELLGMSGPYMRRFSCNPNSTAHRDVSIRVLHYLKTRIKEKGLKRVNQTGELKDPSLEI